MSLPKTLLRGALATWTFDAIAVALVAAFAIGAIGAARPSGRRREPQRAGARAPALADATAAQSPNAYGHALANLAHAEWIALREGKAIFLTTWVPPGAAAAERAIRGPDAQIRDGLGPQFNATSCADCHFRDGRGGPPPDLRDPHPARPVPPRLLRLGLVGLDGQLVAEPQYGFQLQDHALPPAASEAQLEVAFRAIEGHYPDGVPYALQAPDITIRGLARGPLAAGTRRSLRSPPSLIGLGLLEAVPDAALLALADPDDADHDGISGRANHVRDPRTGARVLGRFGWKAGQPSLWLQNATALREDLGVTTPVFPDAGFAAPELDDADLERLTRYTRLLGPPRRRDLGDPDVVRGEQLFTTAGCATCHHPQLTTGDVTDLPELAHQTITPYTDLLLHDLGDALADDRPDGDATGREWRTAPLWGLGLLRIVTGDVRLLHDGRARSPEEAILWHGGEAQAARDRFAQLAGRDRAALLRFLAAL
jgi:CxxC motif-containing protein (DUF1111 family)